MGLCVSWEKDTPFTRFHERVGWRSHIRRDCFDLPRNDTRRFLIMFGKKKKQNKPQELDINKLFENARRQGNKISLEDLVQAARTPGIDSIRNEESMMLMGAFEYFMNSQDDPEDTLFVQFTQRETAALAMAMLTFSFAARRYQMFGDAFEKVQEIRTKIADAMDAQKGTGG